MEEFREGKGDLDLPRRQLMRSGRQRQLPKQLKRTR